MYFYYPSAFIYNLSYASTEGFNNISINHTNSQSYTHGSFARVLTSTVTTLNITDG